MCFKKRLCRLLAGKKAAKHKNWPAKHGQKTRQTKADVIKQNLKTNIVTTNQELMSAYSDWIDAVYANKGWMSKKAIVVGQAVVDEFSKRNLDVALKLIEIATIHGYVDMTWAINRYNEQYNVKRVVSNNTVTPKVASKPAAISTEVF